MNTAFCGSIETQACVRAQIFFAKLASFSTTNYKCNRTLQKLTGLFENMNVFITFEPPRGKTNNLHRRKQRRRSASR